MTRIKEHGESCSDVSLRLAKEEVAWVTPRNIAILAGAVAALAGVVFGVLGYEIGQTPSPPIIINLPAQK